MLSQTEIEQLASKIFAKSITGITIDGIVSILTTACQQAKGDNWIRVEDRLPEKDKEDNNYSETVVTYDGVGIFISYCRFNSNDWVDQFGEPLPNPTHWQPLPTPPNQERKGLDSIADEDAIKLGEILIDDSGSLELVDADRRSKDLISFRFNSSELVYRMDLYTDMSSISILIEKDDNKWADCGMEFSLCVEAIDYLRSKGYSI